MKYTFQANYGTDYRILTYEYDAFDRRVNSHTISVSTGLAARSTYWIWDGQQLALQFSDGDGAGPSAPSRTYRFLYGPGIDQVFNQEGTATSHWLLGDHLGTTREVVDDSGTLQRHYVFDAYGNLQGSTAHTMILFAGRELDAVSGLYYVRARWYDPAVGRWVSEDPIGYAGGDPNLYRYVANSPVNYTDPSGLVAAGGPSDRPVYGPPLPPGYDPDRDRQLLMELLHEPPLILGIHSNCTSDDEGFVLGHAWLSVYDPETGKITYYGLWPDDHSMTFDNGPGTDVRTNLEKYDGRQARYYELTREQKKRLQAYVKTKSIWTKTHNCSSWASDGVWFVVGEDVDADGWGGFEHPSELGDSIRDLEKNDPTTRLRPRPQPPKPGGGGKSK